MATVNATLTREWSLVVAVAVDRALITPAPSLTAPLTEFAVTEADETEPEVSGHLLDIEKGITRDLLGDGAIWGRVSPIANVETADVVIT
jgi:hypothetical protein